MADEDPFPYLSNLVASQQQSNVSRTWTSDLELMHHYTSITWKSLPRGLELREVWQIDLPKLAFSFDFLTHQILAISAAHMAFLHPDLSNNYSTQASQHQNKATHGLRSILTTIDESNCHAIFSAASLLSIASFAALSNPRTRHANPGMEDLLQVFLLIRGMHGVLTSYENIIKIGPIGDLLRTGTYQSNTPFLSEIEAELNSMSYENMDLSDFHCREAVSLLLGWIRHARSHASLPELRVVMTWPTGLSDGYMECLRERHVPALRILACYCRILEFLGEDHWYLKDWGKSVLAGLAEGRPSP